MLRDVTHLPREELQELYEAGLLFFTRRDKKLQSFTAKIAPENPNFLERSKLFGQKFFIDVEY